MSNYEKQNFVSGQILTAAQLNHIEDGIEKILPVIEAGAEKQLISDSEGNLAWIDTTHGYTEKEEILIQDLEIKGVQAQRIESNTFLASVLPEATFKIFINDIEIPHTVSTTSPDVYNILFPNYQNFHLLITPTVVLVAFANKDSVTGSLTISITNKIFNKLNPNYLPFYIRSGEGLKSVIISSGSSNGSLSVSANSGRSEGEKSFSCNQGTANGMYSFASGSLTKANGPYSFCTGFQTTANGEFSFSIGKANIEDTENKYAFTVGNGTLLSNGAINQASNAHTLDWDGNAWFAGTMEGTGVIVKSSTEGSNKRFKISIDDNGTISATEVAAV